MQVKFFRCFIISISWQFLIYTILRIDSNQTSLELNLLNSYFNSSEYSNNNFQLTQNIYYNLKIDRIQTAHETLE